MHSSAETQRRSLPADGRLKTRFFNKYMNPIKNQEKLFEKDREVEPIDPRKPIVADPKHK